jgi:hypothetical protein
MTANDVEYYPDPIINLDCTGLAWLACKLWNNLIGISETLLTFTNLVRICQKFIVGWQSIEWMIYCNIVNEIRNKTEDLQPSPRPQIKNRLKDYFQVSVGVK